MKINLCAFILVLLLSSAVFAGEYIIARGENPQGKSYFAYTGLVSKKGAGWQDNSIPNGIFEVVVSDGNLDVRYVDATKRIMSFAKLSSRRRIVNLFSFCPVCF